MKIYTTVRPNKKNDTNKTKRNKQGRTILVCLAWLVLWQLLSMAVGSELLLPSPYESMAALAELAVTGEFYMNVAWTMLRCIIAMALSLAAGSMAAWFASQHECIRSFLKLPVSFFKAVPVMAVIIYVILLASADKVAVIVCFIMCFPIVYTNMLSGLDSVSRDFLELGKLYGLTKRQLRRLIYFPSVRPNFNAAVRLVCGLSWKAVIAAEVLSIPKYSLGYEMLNAKYYLETAELFAYIAVIVVISVLFEKAVCSLLVRDGRLSLAEVRARCADEKSADSPAARSSSAGAAGSSGSSPETATGCAAAGGILPPAVRLVHLYKSFEDKSVLDDLNLSLSSGKVTAVVGPSGRGKTTIARIIAGLESADSGSVEFEFPNAAEPVCGEAKKGGSCMQTAVGNAVDASSRVRISYLFQEERLLPWLNVYDNMALARINDAGCGLDGEIRSMAEALELSDALFSMPNELSGGMKHRAALGRTFLAESNLIILDEPFRGLDSELKERIISRLWGKAIEGKTVLLISHNSEDCEKLAEEVIDAFIYSMNVTSAEKLESTKLM